MLLVNIRVDTVTDGIIENGFIQIEKTKIKKIGSMTDMLPIDSEVLSFEGRLAMPGLIDAHSHIGMFGDGLGFEGDDGNETTDPITPHIRALDAINPLDRCFREALEYGVTTVVVTPGSANPIAGQIVAMKTHGKCIDKMVIRQDVGMKFALGENPKTEYNARTQTPITRMGIAALIRENLMKAKKYNQDMLEAEKDDELEEPDPDIKIESLLALIKKECTGHFHAHRADDIFTSLRIAKEFDIHSVVVHATEAHLIADELSEMNVSVICGPLIGSRSKPELQNLNIKTPAILNQKGIKIAICTDHPEVPQEYLMLSAALAHRNGLDREEAIKAITINPALICGLDAIVGSLSVGKDADIVIYDEDPICGLAKPFAVFINGVKI